MSPIGIYFRLNTNLQNLIEIRFSFLFQNTRFFINRIFLITFQIKIFKLSFDSLIEITKISV